jgi:hypothetical protein
MVTFPQRKTKTWEGRHENKIAKLVSILSLWEIHDPIVLQVGPGGIAQPHAHLFPKGPEDTMGFTDRKKLQIASMREAGARDKERAKLATYETQELHRALKGSVGLKHLYVVDNDLRVLEAVQRLNLESTTILPHDISNGPVYYDSEIMQANVGLAFKVLEYSGNKQDRALASLMNSVVKSRGFLALTLPERYSLVPTGLTKLADSVYLNGERGDKMKKVTITAPKLDAFSIERAANSVSSTPSRHII